MKPKQDGEDSSGGIGSRPNFFLILADDMGFSDAGSYGGEIHTRNLDMLAANGVRFTQHYSTGRCWPSRACILTGYYAQQVRRDDFPEIWKQRRPAWAHLLPVFLRPLGYRSYHSGKWHLDGEPVRDGGFDRSYRLDDHDRHFYPREHYEDDRPLPPVESGSGYYTATAMADYAARFLSEHHEKYPDRPFFLYLAFTTPHFPLQAYQEDIAPYLDVYMKGWDAIREERWRQLREMGIVNCALSPLDPEAIPSWNLSEAELKQRIGPGECGHAVAWTSLTSEQQRFQSLKMAIHAAMIERMDREIGRVLEQIRAMHAWENTVTIFASDNGGSAEQIIRGDMHDPTAPPGSGKTFLCLGPGWSTVANAPFRLHKSWVHEGGIATPLIVHWPAGLRSRGELRHTVGHLIDIPPTLMELANGKWPTEWNGIALPAIPGRSLKQALERDTGGEDRTLFWSHIGNRALRVGGWKLVAKRGSPWELYDLTVDRCEMRDIASKDRARVREMAACWEDLAAEFRQTAGGDGGSGPYIPEKGRWV